MEKNKLQSKDLIVAGAFAALYIVVMMVATSIAGFIPITFLLSPLIAGIVCGTVYMLYVTKVPKRGAILILAVLVGLVFTSASWIAGIWCVLCGMVAEALAAAGKYRSKKMFTASYYAIACMTVGPFWLLVLAREQYLASAARFGEEYAAALDALSPSWMILVLIGLGILGGLIGAAIGKRALKKHFEKAGVV